MPYIYEILLKIPAAIVALTVSSFARHSMAFLLGDETPKIYGKLTLMPTEHLDPVGFLMMLLFRFGWTKPPAINTKNFSNKKNSLILFFISSPIANLLTAIVFSIFLSFLIRYPIFNSFKKELTMILDMIVIFNISFAALSFLPFPPFTGYYIIKEFLPYDIKLKVSKIENYSLVILILVIYTGFLNKLLFPLIIFFAEIVSFFGGLFI